MRTGDTKPDEDVVWAAIDDQRQRTAAMLEQLTDEQWDHPSLCDGWTVRHLAAHLTLQRQHVSDAIRFLVEHPRLLRCVTLNRMIHDSAVVQSSLQTDELITRIRAGIGSRRHNVVVTPYETLSDSLVHAQDIAIPLGIDLEMRTEAAAIAATRIWQMRRTWLGTVFRQLPLDGHRVVATDVEWSVGSGSEIAGPISAILLLLTGRRVALDWLTGEGAGELRRRAQPA